MLLAADVGGTTTRLGLFRREPDRPLPIRTARFASLDHDGMAAMLDEFLAPSNETGPIESACFGVAGPVLEGTARLTNVPWTIEAAEIGSRFGIARIALLNDLEAMAYSVSALGQDELATLQEGEPLGSGSAALIAAGTGLGEALLHNQDGHFVPAASEAGHADFAARTPRELDFVRDLSESLGRVRLEDVLSGSGLVNLYCFVHDEPCVAGTAENPDDVPAQITTSALAGDCRACVEALEMFVSAYGAEAGNLALRSTATGGIYVGGGIAPQILPALESGGFLEAFRNKPPMTDLLAAVPVAVILHPQPGLLGAAVHAAELL
ncbi:MAG: glucokinase [Vicinamibacterales bacterium]|jgi:glucokinase|nr:glucokinase [Acidobacteriota bacterium]MDP7294510.1 glucokinase [Vicinamibacterales bacterium]MDP7472289.1 glucokinase [Vicinamibacterales bacterium]MDP7670652.1 glucokinase [Vicinamibacterales bacterium]HJO39065.1 glucokinase [Vicinamibacterales bacterium]|tara:strand:- start:2435 stop:3403 length:969 start_codon:yes stop_codon:yes gene_type:complete